MMKTKKIKNLKPTEINVHLKYTCPECGVDHWLSLDEAKCKDYITICYCKAKLKVKPVKSIHIVYLDKKDHKPEPQEKLETMPVEILENCVKILLGYGYSKQEAVDLVKDSYSKNPIDDSLGIIKNILANIGGKNG